MDRAACKGQTEKFFPPTQMKRYNEFLKVAQAICAVCPVKEECIDYVLEFPLIDIHGVWGGMTRRELGREARRRGVTPFRPTIVSTFDWAEVKADRLLVQEIDDLDKSS